MEFKEGKCPKCQGVLQIPANRDRIICMYCGEELFADDAIENQQGQAVVPKIKPQDYDNYVNIAMNELPNLLLRIEKPLENFKRDKYPANFENYYRINEEILKAVENAYLFADNGVEFINEAAANFVQVIHATLESSEKKRAKERKLMDYNLCMAVYVIPAILEYKGEASELLADTILAAWKKQYPTTNLGKSTFENINSGFRKKLCYITTAVCQTLGKGDSCYELNLLREYRDNYLIYEPGGREIVSEYYDIAPTIVKRINRLPNYKQVYEEVWKKYLSKCISLIEKNKRLECKEVYSKMVRELQQQYCFS